MFLSRDMLDLAADFNISVALCCFVIRLLSEISQIKHSRFVEFEISVVVNEI